MDDAILRANLHKTYLLKSHKSKDVLVLDELGLKHGKCRADIAVINGRLEGFEIKSDEDSLVRLESQIVTYSEVFDRATIVVGNRYLNKVESVVPNWWGILWGQKREGNKIEFKQVRKGRLNPGVKALSVAQLLWRSEAISILEELGVSDKALLRSKRLSLYNEVVSRLPIAKLRSQVISCLKSRKGWRSASQQAQCDDWFLPKAM